MKVGVIITGGALIALGFAGYLYPITSVGSASDVHELCTSGFGQLGKALSEQIRENCQAAKYMVVGTYAAMGIGALLVIIGSVLRDNAYSSSREQHTLTLSYATKTRILIGVGIIVASVAIIVIYFLTLQPNIQVTDVNIIPTQNEQFVKVLDSGRVSTAGNFYYAPKQAGTYYLVYSNDFSIISTKYVSTSYTDNGKSYTQSFEVPAGAYKSIPVYADTNQAITGNFGVSGGSGSDVDFYIAYQACTQTLRFSFTLTNRSPVDGNAVVSLEENGQSIWSNNYFVKSNTLINEDGTASIVDCYQHDLQIVVSQQQRVG